ncbi:MAG: hypothetical protein ABI629_26630, partial [bacterium]
MDGADGAHGREHVLVAQAVHLIERRTMRQILHDQELALRQPAGKPDPRQPNRQAGRDVAIETDLASEGVQLV